MSNYVKATNFTAKDSLQSGNPSKIIKGAEIDDEFNAIATAVATKPDSNSPTLTGVPVAPTATAGTNTTQIATTAFVTNERTATATLENKTITSPVINQIIHEGTADDFETSLVFTDPTADRTLTFPDKSGTIALTSEIAVASTLTTSSGTYAVAGSSTVTVTMTAHGRSVNDVVYLNFTSGNLADGYFTIASVTTNSFTFNYGSTQTTSGNVTGYYSNLGTVAIASPEEVLAGISTTRAATPAGVQSILLGVNQTWQNMISSRNDTVLTAGSFVVGNIYTIITVGTTNFTAIGASSNSVGVVFTATGAGSGTGTARNTYKNTTGKPIVVNVMTDQGANFGSTITATISGVSFTIGIDSNSNGGHNAVGNVIVPNNATYMIVASGNGVSGFDEWVELR
jgi:hypothetical protein